MRGVWLLWVFTLTTVSPVRAEPKSLPPDEDICLTVAHVWNGGRADVEHITDTPIPASFRAEMAKTGCTRFQLVDESLIDWHLRFGTEATTTAALAYLAGEYGRGAELDGPKPDRWVELATMAVRAAELYRSPALLALSDRYAARAAEGPPPGGRVESHRERTARLELRRAALRALLTRSAVDITAARELLSARSTPAFEALRNASFRRDICDGDPADPALAPVRSACGSASNFERDALDFWEASARLALAKAKGTACADYRDLRAVGNAVALLTSRLDRNDAPSSWPDYIPERLVSLLLSRSEQAASPACQRADEGWAAREALLRAERLTPVATAPARFRMIADRYLSLRIAPDDRWAATSRVVIARLDEITAATEKATVR